MADWNSGYFCSATNSSVDLGIFMYCISCKYLLPTEFEVHTVSSRLSFFPFELWPKHEAPRSQMLGKKWGSITCSTDQENEVSKIFIMSLLLVWRVQERFLSMKNGFKFLKRVKSKRSQSEITFKSLARFSTQFRVKESFKPLLAKQ